MTHNFWNKSLDITNVPEKRRDELGTSLRGHGLSHEFKAQSGSFTYVKPDEATAADLIKAFPDAKLTASATAIEIRW